MLHRFIGDISTHARREPLLAEICVVFARAEGLAMRCATAQALACPHPGVRRLLFAQARHERAHVALFEAIVRAVGHNGGRASRTLQLLDAYETRVLAALKRGDLAESLVGMQVVFEGLAADLFRCVDLSPCYLPLAPVRRALQLQEQSHHDLGIRALGALVSCTASAGLWRTGEEYAPRASELLESCDILLDRFSLRSRDYDPRGTLAAGLARLEAA